MNYFRMILMVLTFVSSCRSSEHDKSSLDYEPIGANQRKQIVVSVSVDWEAKSLTEENINSMAYFNDRNKEDPIPLIQFLNMASYTKPDANPSEITKKIKRALKPEDEIGIHIHGWKSLYEAAGAKYIDEPALVSFVDETQCDVDCGHSVPIWVYSAEDNYKVLEFSKQKLIQHGFITKKELPISFRAGAWMADRTVREALIKSGFLFDTSSTDYRYLQVRLPPGEIMLDEIKRIWPGSDKLSQPYVIEEGNGKIYEMPDNGNLADYITTDEMFNVYKENLDKIVNNGEQIGFVHIGFHHETAATKIANVESAIYRMREHAEKNNIDLKIMTFKQLYSYKPFLEKFGKINR